MPANSERSPDAVDAVPLPWWRVGMVWFMLSGPAIVVVAGIATMVVAYRGAETVVSEAPPVARLLAEPAARAVAPALQGRNHAATPGR